MILRDTETEPEENVKGRSGRERRLKKKTWTESQRKMGRGERENGDRGGETESL